MKVLIALLCLHTYEGTPEKKAGYGWATGIQASSTRTTGKRNVRTWSLASRTTHNRGIL